MTPSELEQSVGNLVTIVTDRDGSREWVARHRPSQLPAYDHYAESHTDVLLAVCFAVCMCERLKQVDAVAITSPVTRESVLGAKDADFAYLVVTDGKVTLRRGDTDTEMTFGPGRHPISNFKDVVCCTGKAIIEAGIVPSSAKRTPIVDEWRKTF